MPPSSSPRHEIPDRPRGRQVPPPGAADQRERHPGHVVGGQIEVDAVLESARGPLGARAGGPDTR